MTAYGSTNNKFLSYNKSLLREDPLKLTKE